MEFLTDIQKVKIEAFCKDTEMFEAVKKVLLAGIYEHGTLKQEYTPNPLQNGAFALASVAINNPVTDEILGQHIRAMWSGLNALENAYHKLETIKSVGELVESDYNEAI